MAIKIDSDWKIQVNGVATQGPLFDQTVLELSKWLKVRDSLGFITESMLTVTELIAQVTIDGVSQDFQYINKLNSQFTYANNDVVRIGGPSSFIGDIARFKVYYPGAYSNLSIIHKLFVI